jgi:very-short-patch-repair endonuclease
MDDIRRNPLTPPSPARGEGNTMSQRARELRKGMTDAERKLWSALRQGNSGFKFRRQEPIGPYVADFVCFEKKLVVEVDGGQHMDSPQDRVRDGWLQSRGFTVLRFWNREVLRNRRGVTERIQEMLRPPHPTLSRKGRGEIERCPS